MARRAVRTSVGAHRDLEGRQVSCGFQDQYQLACGEDGHVDLMQLGLD